MRKGRIGIQAIARRLVRRATTEDAAGADGQDHRAAMVRSSDSVGPGAVPQGRDEHGRGLEQSRAGQRRAEGAHQVRRKGEVHPQRRPGDRHDLHRRLEQRRMGHWRTARHQSLPETTLSGRRAREGAGCVLWRPGVRARGIHGDHDVRQRRLSRWRACEREAAQAFPRRRDQLYQRLCRRYDETELCQPVLETRRSELPSPARRQADRQGARALRRLHASVRR